MSPEQFPPRPPEASPLPEPPPEPTEAMEPKERFLRALDERTMAITSGQLELMGWTKTTEDTAYDERMNPTPHQYPLVRWRNGNWQIEDFRRRDDGDPKRFYRSILITEVPREPRFPGEFNAREVWRARIDFWGPQDASEGSVIAYLRQTPSHAVGIRRSMGTVSGVHRYALHHPPGSAPPVRLDQQYEYRAFRWDQRLLDENVPLMAPPIA